MGRFRLQCPPCWENQQSYRLERLFKNLTEEFVFRFFPEISAPASLQTQNGPAVAPTDQTVAPLLFVLGPAAADCTETVLIYAKTINTKPIGEDPTPANPGCNLTTESWRRRRRRDFRTKPNLSFSFVRFILHM